jgi:hypothetical protein
MLKKLVTAGIATAILIATAPVSAQGQLSMQARAGSKYRECQLPLVFLPEGALPIMVARKSKLESCRAIKLRDIRRNRLATESPGKISPLSNIPSRAHQQEISRYMKRPIKDLYFMSI